MALTLRTMDTSNTLWVPYTQRYHISPPFLLAIVITERGIFAFKNLSLFHLLRERYKRSSDTWEKEIRERTCGRQAHLLRKSDLVKKGQFSNSELAGPNTLVQAALPAYPSHEDLIHHRIPARTSLPHQHKTITALLQEAADKVSGLVPKPNWYLEQAP